jgi:hypothetical protein
MNGLNLLTHIHYVPIAQRGAKLFSLRPLRLCGELCPFPKAMLAFFLSVCKIIYCYHNRTKKEILYGYIGTIQIFPPKGETARAIKLR